MVCYGPVPSRRFGRSLGINNIPFEKVCSYSFFECLQGSTCHRDHAGKGVNDTPDGLEKTSSLIKELNPDISYISIPIHPSALNTVNNAIIYN